MLTLQRSSYFSAHPYPEQGQKRSITALFLADILGLSLWLYLNYKII
jgi:hypothetical protein